MGRRGGLHRAAACAAGAALALSCVAGCSDDAGDGNAEAGAGAVAAMTGGAGGAAGVGGNAGAAGVAGATGGTGGVAGVGGAAGSAGTGMVDAGPPEPGSCAPVAGPDRDALEQQGVLERVLDTGIGNLRDFEVRDGDLYWTADNIGLSRVPVEGGTPEVLVAFDPPSVFWIGETHLYWAVMSGSSEPLLVWRVPLDDWSATPEEIPMPSPEGLRDIEGDQLYGYDRTAQRLWRQDFTTGAVSDVLVPADAAGMDVHDGFVYFGDDTLEDLQRVSVDGGAAERITNGSHFDMAAVVILGETIYWSDHRGMYRTTVAAVDAGMDDTVRMGGYGPGDGIGNRSAWIFSEHGDRLYWADDNGNVGWTSNDRLDCGTIHSADSFAHITFGPDYVYVVDRGIYRVPL